MGAFRQLDETKLAELDDAGLIEYVFDTCASGKGDPAGVALKIFAFGKEDVLRTSRRDGGGETRPEAL